MSKIYVPTYEDLKVNNGTELQLKAPGSGKTLAECELGEVVHIPETISDVKDFHDYIVVEKNQDNVILLRKYVAGGDHGKISNDMGAYVRGHLYVSDKSVADVWCSTTFINRFSAATQEYITTKGIKVISNTNGTTTVYLRKAFLPSTDELGGTPNIGSGEGTSVWFTTNEQRAALSETDKVTVINYWTRTLHERTSGMNDYHYFDYVDTDGIIKESTNYQGSYITDRPYRPCVVFLPTTPLNGDNQFIDEPVYTDTIHDIRFGDNIYKIKDSDARDLLATLQTALGGKQDALTAGSNISISSNVISATVPVTDVQDSSGTSLVSGGVATIPSGGGFIVTSDPAEAAQHPDMLWIDPSDNTIDPDNRVENDVLVPPEIPLNATDEVT